MADFAVRIQLAASSPVPAYNVTPWSAGFLAVSSGEATTETTGLLLDCSPVGEYADIARGGNYAAVGEWTVTMHAATPAGTKWWEAFSAAGASLYGARVELWDTTANVCRAVGTVTEAKRNGVVVDISCESISVQRHKEIPTRKLTAEEFPGLTEEFEGYAVPIVYGPAERLEPASFLTEPEALDSLMYVPAPYVFIMRPATFIAIYSGAPASTIDSIPVVVCASSDLFAYQIDAVDQAFAAGKLYVRITDGTGSGQERKVETLSYTAGTTSGGVYEKVAIVGVASPLETAADETSEIRFYRRDVGAVLAVCDEGEVSEVRDSEYDSPVPFAPSLVGTDVVAADVSAEFAAGENYQSIQYLRPSEVFGITALQDGLCASGQNVARGYGIAEGGPGGGTYFADLFCRSRLDLATVDGEWITRGPDIYALVSLAVQWPTPAEIEGIYIQAKAIRWDGSEEFVWLITDKLIDDGPSVNCFSPAMAADGTAGNFAGYAAKIDLARPLTHYRSILIGAAFRGALTYIFGEDRYTPQPGYWDGPIPFVNGQSYIVWDNAVLKIPPGRPGEDAIADGLLWISPANFYEARNALDDNTIYSVADNYNGLASSDMYRVTSIELISGEVYRVNLDKPITCPSGNYDARCVTQDMLDHTSIGEPLEVNEYESGFALSFGEVAQDSVFLASMRSGRKSGGTPIIYAKDAAVDLMTRDLGLGSGEIDTASFAALPNDEIRMSIVDVERTDEIIARMAREFNWIVSHDGSGKERAVTWLDRVGTASSDWAITSADVVKDSMQISMTDIKDIICEPQTEWDWTFSDGYRQKGAVNDITFSPASLTSANYLRYISGFGDFASASAIFTVLNNLYKVSLERGHQSVQYMYGGSPLTLYVGDLADWCAVRKTLLDFKIPEDRASAASVVGDRISISHRRVGTGGVKYGTICGRWWHPVDGVVQLLVMLDP